MKTVKKLCTPAYVYLVISVISIVILMFQNAGNKNIFCLGSYECDVPSTGVVFVVQVLYTMFWVFVLNAICSAGYEKVSWFLVLLPYLFLFIALGMLLLGQPVREGLSRQEQGKAHVRTRSTNPTPRWGKRCPSPMIWAMYARPSSTKRHVWEKPVSANGRTGVARS